MRKKFAIFLMLVFATTVLPIGQVGRLLASNQLNEEVCQQANQLLEEKVKDCHFDTSYLPHALLAPFETAAYFANPRLQHKEEIPTSPSSDILMPPPKGIAI
jgi:hypothetical protein